MHIEPAVPTTENPAARFAGDVWLDPVALPHEPGQTIYTPPGEEHWHAAAPGCFMEHIAMLQNSEDPSETTLWGEHITDDEYNGRPPV
jgi:hypothetical protein